MNYAECGGVFYEALLSKKILLTYRDENKYEDIYPILNAKTPEQICNQIYYYFNNKKIIEKKTEEAFLWFKEKVINNSLIKYFNIINNEQSKL